MDNKKVYSVLKCHTLQTIKELQRFLGFVNFYKRFIRNYRTIVAPPTSLTKGGMKRLI